MPETLAEARKMWEGYELYGLATEGNPLRSDNSIEPTAAIVMVLRLLGHLHSTLHDLAASQRRIEALERAIVMLYDDVSDHLLDDVLALVTECRASQPGANPDGLRSAKEE